MRNPSQDSRIGLYRPGMSSPFRRMQLTVGRSEILLDTLDHLRSAADRKSKHHFLFLGPRGSGKSHLLEIIEDGIHEDPRLAPRMVVAKFPEEAIRTLSFADLLKKLVSILAERLEDEPQWHGEHNDEEKEFLVSSPSCSLCLCGLTVLVFLGQK